MNSAKSRRKIKPLSLRRCQTALVGTKTKKIDEPTQQRQPETRFGARNRHKKEQRQRKPTSLHDRDSQKQDLVPGIDNSGGNKEQSKQKYNQPSTTKKVIRKPS